MLLPFNGWIISFSHSFVVRWIDCNCKVICEKFNLFFGSGKITNYYVNWVNYFGKIMSVVFLYFRMFFLVLSILFKFNNRQENSWDQNLSKRSEIMIHFCVARSYQLNYVSFMFRTRLMQSSLMNGNFTLQIDNLLNWWLSKENCNKH